MNPEESEDLTQAFFVHLLEDGALRRADKEKGKLRTFLLGSMKHYLLNWRRAEHAVKRGGKLQRVEFDTREVEAVCSSAGADLLSPDALYERRWAVTLLDHAMSDLELEQIRGGRGSQFTVLQDFLLTHGKDVGYGVAAEKLGVTENHVRVMVHRLRKRYRELVRLHVASTVETEVEVEDELRHLLSLF